MFGLEKDDFVSIIITAVVGFVGGAFLYVVHFAKLTAPDPVAEQEELLEFSVVGRVYGSCGEACPAFQLQKNGAYRYRYMLDRNQPAQLKEGFLPIDIQRDVKQSLDVATLEDESEPVSNTACNSQSGGIDFRYEISYKGQSYTVDSCTTAVNGEGELWNSLSAVWNYFQTVQN